jgi:hypothetical protein
LLVELHLDNPNNQIQPGSYAQVCVNSGSLGQIVTLPNNMLLFRAQGLQVGVVKPYNSVELRDIKVGRDFGTTIEIVHGVTPSDKVILNPADSLVTRQRCSCGITGAHSRIDLFSIAGREEIMSPS